MPGLSRSVPYPLGWKTLKRECGGVGGKGLEGDTSSLWVQGWLNTVARNVHYIQAINFSQFIIQVGITLSSLSLKDNKKQIFVVLLFSLAKVIFLYLSELKSDPGYYLYSWFSITYLAVF